MTLRPQNGHNFMDGYIQSLQEQLQEKEQTQSELRKQLDYANERIEELEKVLREIGEMNKVGWNKEYVLKRYAEYARKTLR